jgi:hypothetical protein
MKLFFVQPRTNTNYHKKYNVRLKYFVKFCVGSWLTLIHQFLELLLYLIMPDIIKATLLTTEWLSKKSTQFLECFLLYSFSIGI